MTQNGDQPTPFNTTPHEDDEQGRGSMVWFNQAASLQSAHLLYDTVMECLSNDAPTYFDDVVKLDADIFPTLS
jgi:hypothetical protein